VLLAVEAYCDAMDVPGFYAVDWEKYRQMRAAFYAYRASIEAGAPLGWAVAEEEQEVEA
jgi:hypothetical protein